MVLGKPGWSAHLGTLADIARSYNINPAPISWLQL
jgi:hypothetical protein